MKKILSSLFLLITSIGYSQTTLIPDPNFEQYLIDEGKDVGPINGSVPTANIVNMNSLVAIGYGITDFTGVEDFASINDILIHEFDSSQSITGINLTMNQNLRYIYIHNSRINTLDSIKCIPLNIREFILSKSQLSSVDFSTFPNLTSIHVHENPLLNNIDISNNPYLNYVRCSSSQISSIDLSNVPNLGWLECSSSQISSLDLSNVPNLGMLQCSNTQISSLDLSNVPNLSELQCSNTQISSLDLSKLNVLNKLNASNNSISCLNVKNGNNSNFTLFDVSNNPNLNCIEVDDVDFSTSNWTNIDAHHTFSMYCGNQCSSYDCGTIPANQICFVTVDQQTGKNKVVWESFDLYPITDSILIYRDIAGVYNYVGSVSSTDSTYFIDNSISANPSTTSYRYKITSKDTCQMESGYSDFHQTIHLQVSQGVSNQYNLSWTNYVGFSYGKYRILRDDFGNGIWNVIDSVGLGINSYTDINPPSPSSRYIVEILHPNGCNVTGKGLETSTRSNLGDYTTGINQNDYTGDIKIQPNPSSNYFTIHSNYSIDKTINIFNSVGQLVFETKTNNQTYTINVNEIGSKGIYFIKVLDNKKNILKHEKLVVQ